MYVFIVLVYPTQNLGDIGSESYVPYFHANNFGKYILSNTSEEKIPVVSNPKAHII